MLFSDRSLWTMLHGIVLGGGALMALAAALFAIAVMRGPENPHAASDTDARALSRLLVLTAALLWLTVVVGTYFVFPAYRATPPEGVTDLRAYPRALLMSDPGTSWLHAFGMESKEHMPWIASMLATAVAFVSVRYRAILLTDTQLRTMAMALLAICFALGSFVGLMGIFADKVAPLH